MRRSSRARLVDMIHIVSHIGMCEVKRTMGARRGRGKGEGAMRSNAEGRAETQRDETADPFRRSRNSRKTLVAFRSGGHREGGGILRLRDVTRAAPAKAGTSRPPVRMTLRGRLDLWRS